MPFHIFLCARDAARTFLSVVGARSVGARHLFNSANYLSFAFSILQKTYLYLGVHIFRRNYVNLRVGISRGDCLDLGAHVLRRSHIDLRVNLALVHRNVAAAGGNVAVVLVGRDHALVHGVVARIRLNRRLPALLRLLGLALLFRAPVAEVLAHAPSFEPLLRIGLRFVATPVIKVRLVL